MTAFWKPLTGQPILLDYEGISIACEEHLLERHVVTQAGGT